MKKVGCIVISALLGMTLATGIGVSLSNKEVIKTEATDYSSSSHINSYYSNVNGSGTSLLSSVCSAISSPFTSISYSNLKDYYETTDPRDDGKLYDIYSDDTNYTVSSAGSSASAIGGGWNKEHTVVKSWWGGQETGQGCDIIIVRLSDIHCNSVRSSLLYGEVATSTDNSIGENKKGSCSNYSEIGVSSGTVVFEPRDSIKGDMARTYFYAAARYWTSGSGNGGVKTWTTGNGSYIFSNSGNNGFVQNYLNMLLRWHTEDPVDEREIARNAAVESCQKNRNPFIDHPSWVDLIWGGTYTGTNSEDTSSGTVTNGQLSSTGITSISKTSISLIKNNTTTISATSSNSGTISWSSSNTSVATVSSATASSGSNVTITAVGAGSATITASITISGKSYSKTCSVTVSNTKTLASISVSGQTTSFTVGDTFSFGGTVTANYNDSTSANVTTSATFSGYDMSNAGNQTVTVSYTESGTTKTTTYSITVSASGGQGGGEEDYEMLASISSIDESANYVLGVEGTGFHYDGTSSWGLVALPSSQTPLYYTLTKGNGNTSFTAKTKISGTSYYLTVPTSNTFTMSTSSTSIKLGTTTEDSNGSPSYAVTNTSTTTRHLRINGSSGLRSYAGTTGTMAYFYKVNESSYSEPTLTSITLNTDNVKKTFTVGETFIYTGLVVTANYSNSTSEVVTPTSVSSPNMSTAGQKTVTVTYNTVSATYNITVNAAATTSISASVSKTFYVGETITKSDITVKDNNNTTITDFTFSNYQFTYSDAASGGALTNKTFTNAISHNALSCSLTVQVQRKARNDSSTNDYSIFATDLPTAYQTTNISYTSASGIQFDAYNCAHYSASGKLQFKASGGYLQTTQSLNLKTLTIVNRETNALTVYGSNTAGSFSTTISGTNDVYNLQNYKYVKIMKNGSGAAYCTELILTVVEETPANLANYIMYADTSNQCTSKFSVAKGYFENMSSSGRSTFMTSSDYVIATARARFEAWATSLGKTITYTNGDYVVSNARVMPNVMSENSSEKLIPIIIAISLATITFVGGYYFLKRKKEK